MASVYLTDRFGFGKVVLQRDLHAVPLTSLAGPRGWYAAAVVSQFLTEYSADFLGAACQLVAYGIISPAGPFPVMCCAFFLIGYSPNVEHEARNQDS